MSANKVKKGIPGGHGGAQAFFPMGKAILGSTP
jgi:hypothetical protein